MLPALVMFRPETDGTCKGAVHFLMGFPNTFWSMLSASLAFFVPCGTHVEPSKQFPL